MHSVIDFGNINLRAHTFKIKAELRVAFVMQLKHVYFIINKTWILQKRSISLMGKHAILISCIVIPVFTGESKPPALCPEGP